MAFEHHGHFCTNMEFTLLKPPVVSQMGLNCFELIFFNKLGWLWGYFHCLAWEGKSVLILIRIIGRSKKLYEGLIKQHPTSLYY